MSLVPTWPIAAATLVFGLAVGAGGMHVWNVAKVAALKTEIAQTKQKQAEGVSQQYKDYVDGLNAAAANIQLAAQAGNLEVSALGAKLDTINRNIKNVKVPALPVDCRPGTVRVRNLAESAAAVDQAIARSVSGK